MKSKAVFSAGLVYADGNPITVKSALTPLQALECLDRLNKTYPRTPPAKLVWLWDDPEAGYFDADRIIEYMEEHQEWPEYEQAIEDEENGPDMTSADLHG